MFEFSAVNERVARKQKAVAFLADIDESRLHTADDVLHFSLVDIADDTSEVRAFDGKIQQFSVVDYSRARTIRRVVENELFHFAVYS